jgi:hypothetical protein
MNLFIIKIDVYLYVFEGGRSSETRWSSESRCPRVGEVVRGAVVYISCNTAFEQCRTKLELEITFTINHLNI